MRYILNSEGYIEAVIFGGLLTCNNNDCTEYTGSIPSGYESLEEWNDNANIQAYKIEDGNLVYDSDKDAELQALWQEQEENNKSEIVGNKVTTIDSSSTDTQYPSAKAVYNAISESGGGSSGGGADVSTLADLFYPIGRGFLDFTDTDYSNWLGLTWERELVGMTPIGKDENDTDYATVGATGGKKTLTLKKENLPNYTLYNAKHRHSHPNSLMGNNGIKATAYTSGETNTYYQVGMVSKYTDYATITVTSGGSDTPIDLRTPYKVVSYWKRIA